MTRGTGGVGTADPARTRAAPLRRLWRWIQAHEALQAPYPSGRANTLGLSLTALLAVGYAIILGRYTTGLQHTFRTNAEDLGIMIQVLWSIVHGHGMHQTICNPVSDLNCAAGTSRYAIHFEPMLYLVSLVYRVFPSVSAILIVQVVVVASGAFPAYLIATRRLRHPAWGVVAAAALLVYPPLLGAVIDDFHPETLAVTLLLWAFYFLTVRRYRALVAMCVLALLCKETMTLDVIAIGCFVAIVHRRPRLGLALIGLGVGTLALALTLMHLTSPLGHSPVTGRLDALLHQPVQTILGALHDGARRAYLVKLLLPLGFLPLLSPWMAVLAAPSIALNALSTDPAMYSGRYQYNTDIAAVLLVASIDALAWLVPILRMVWSQLIARAPLHMLRRPLAGVAIIALLVIAIAGESSGALAHGYTAVQAIWPQTNTHTRVGTRMLSLIPAGASVSAQSMLVPHLSDRLKIYQFPAGIRTAQYVFVDASSANFYPFTSPQSFTQVIQGLLSSRAYVPVAADNGYLLLHHVAAGHGTAMLPSSFYSFIYASPPATAKPIDARFGNALQLVAYSVTVPPTLLGQPALFVTTYWRALTLVRQPVTITVTLARPDGTRDIYEDLIGQEWLPATQWQRGRITRMETWPIYLPPGEHDMRVAGIEVRVGAPASNPGPAVRLPVTLHLAAPASAASLPRITDGGLNLLLQQVRVG